MAKILVVDDSELARNAVRSALSPDHEVTEAADGVEALKKCQEERPDLVICDILMPRLDGLKFIQTLKTQTSRPGVIVCSAVIQRSVIARAMSLGAKAYLSKPVTQRGKELREAVRAALGGPDMVVLTDVQREALRGMIHAGIERAGAMFSELVATPVRIALSDANVMSLEDADGHLREILSKEAITVQQGFSGPMTGSAFLLFPMATALHVLNLMTLDALRTNGLSESGKAALMEVGNILINACVGSLANVLGIEVEFDLPRIEVGVPETVNAFVGGKEIVGPLRVILIETRFSVGKEEIAGFFNVLLESRGIEAMLNRLSGNV